LSYKREADVSLIISKIVCHTCGTKKKLLFLEEKDEIHTKKNIDIKLISNKLVKEKSKQKILKENKEII
jgi:hypothetical protein